MVVLQLEFEEFIELMTWLNYSWSKTKEDLGVSHTQRNELSRLITEVRTQVVYPPHNTNHDAVS